MKAITLAVLAVFLSLPLTGVSAKEVPFPDVPRIPKEALKLILGNPDVIILDVRIEDQWQIADGKIVRAIHEDPEKYESWANKYPREKILILYCVQPSEATSARTAQRLKEKGFSKTFALKGGWREWKASAFPIQKKLSEKQECAKCHGQKSPKIVSDWQLSKHGRNEVSCSVCHGARHVSEKDVDQVVPVKPDKCAMCHQIQVDQFKSGKHSKAWSAMKAMPTAHRQPMVSKQGMKGCGGCHRIGLKAEAEIGALKEKGSDFGIASCDACHTRHNFSVKEARQPQVCQTCHMGFDTSQWEIYSSSKHGVKFLIEQSIIPLELIATPSCQICHMQKGDHAVRTAWGFLAVRLPMPDDKQWASDRTIILQALGVLDRDATPTARLNVLKAADVARFTQKDWQKERDKMLMICKKCHSFSDARKELEKGDQMIKAVDRLMAEAIRIVAELYQDGILDKPESYPDAFPDLLALHDAPTVIEQKLFTMFFQHRTRAFQGTFHTNPDYAERYGWSEMRKGLTEIRSLAAALQEKNK
jgi:rhodanese-related sulfurtransferase